MVIDQVQHYLPNFLLLNIVPVICHQENTLLFGERIRETNLLHIKVTTEMKRTFLVPRVSILKHALMIPTMIKHVLVDGKRIFPPSLRDISEMDLLSAFCMYSVEKGLVVSSYISDRLVMRPDFGKFIFKLEEESYFHTNTLCKSNCQCPEEFVVELTKWFPCMKKILSASRKHPRIDLEEPRGGLKTNDLSQSKLTRRDTNIQVEPSGSLNEVLENAKMRNFFKAFLSNKFCLELVIFIEQVNMYRMLAQQKEVSFSMSMTNLMEEVEMNALMDGNHVAVEKKGQYIVDTFLDDNALFQINTSKKLINGMKQTLKEKGFVPTLFNDIVNEIKGAVLVQLFEEFVSTDIYQEMLRRVLKSV